MKHAPTALLLFVLGAQVALPTAAQESTSGACEVQCPSGYLGICVKRDDVCRCACARDAEAGATELARVLREAGASERAVHQATERYREFASKGETSFTFELVDGPEIYTVSQAPEDPAEPTTRR